MSTRNRTKTIYIPPTCMFCHAPPEEMLLDSAGLRLWLRQGVKIQDAFPDLDVDVRELIKSGIHPECWERMFADEEK